MATTLNRTWRLQAFFDYGATPSIEFLREQVKIFEDGDHKRANQSTVQRSVSAISNQILPGGQRTLATYGDLIALLLLVGDELADEDIAAFSAVREAEEAAAAAAIEAKKVGVFRQPEATPEESAPETP